VYSIQHKYLFYVAVRDHGAFMFWKGQKISTAVGRGLHRILDRALVFLSIHISFLFNDFAGLQHHCFKTGHGHFTSPKILVVIYYRRPWWDFSHWEVLFRIMPTPCSFCSVRFFDTAFCTLKHKHIIINYLF
jgi:hypothetical protein